MRVGWSQSSELTGERLERLEITADTVLQELAKIAFSNMKDCWSVREDGSIYVDLSRITAIQAAGLADLRIDEYESATGCIRRTRVRLGQKTRALELLGKHLRLWADQPKEKHNLSLVEAMKKARERVLRGMSDEELKAKIKQLQMQLETRHPKVNVEFVSPGDSLRTVSLSVKHRVSVMAQNSLLREL